MSIDSSCVRKVRRLLVFSDFYRAVSVPVGKLGCVNVALVPPRSLRRYSYAMEGRTARGGE